MVEANLPLIVFVLDASRAQQNVVVVVGAVQAQLLVRSTKERKKEHDSNRAPCSQNDPHQCHFYEWIHTKQKKPRIGHDLKQKLAARSTDPGEFGTSLVFRPQNYIADELNTLKETELIESLTFSSMPYSKKSFARPHFWITLRKISTLIISCDRGSSFLQYCT